MALGDRPDRSTLPGALGAPTSSVGVRGELGVKSRLGVRFYWLARGGHVGFRVVGVRVGTGPLWVPFATTAGRSKEGTEC